MAKPMCMSEDGQPAAAIISLMENGESFTLCDDHLAMWCASMLQAMTGVDPTPFIAALSDPDTVPEDLGGAEGGEPPAPSPTGPESGPQTPTPGQSASPPEPDAGTPENAGAEAVSSAGTETAAAA